MSPSTTQNIIIVGGGSAGITAFNAIDAKLPATSSTNLILVTPTPYFIHLIAMIRTVVTSEGHLEDQVLMPLPEKKYNTGNRKVVIGRVASIEDSDTGKGRFVMLDNGERLEYSVLILAPGSTWEGPLNLSDDKQETLESIRSWRTRFEKAKDIVLVGGGAVGVEYAGEIKDQWPNKNVTIIHGQPLLMNGTYPDRWRRKVTQGVEARGVYLVLDDVLENLEPQDGKVVTRLGKSIRADLVIPTRGPRPNTKFIEPLGPDVLTSTGFVKVQPTLQLINHPRIFAAGDVVDWKEQKQAVKAGAHAAIVASNTLALLEIGGAKTLKHYKGSSEMILITNGKNGGSAYLGILWGIVLGDWFARMMKSKDLLIGMVKKNLGL